MCIYILCDIIYIYIVCVYIHILYQSYMWLWCKKSSALRPGWWPGCYDDLSDFTSSRAHLGRLEPEVRLSFGCQLKILEV